MGDTTSSQYLEGGRAAIAGKEFWENPHSGLHNKAMDFHQWFAGWCNAKLSEKEATDAQES